MKISNEFKLMDIANVNVVVPLGTRNLNVSKMISLNDSGSFLWQQLETEKSEEALLAAMMDEYEIDEITAAADLKSFIYKLKEAGVLE